MPRLAPLVLLAALALGCDAASGWLAGLSGGEQPAAAEGWESLESEGDATRLYYQFVDASRQVRFVERLDDVPEAQRASVGFVKMAMAPPLSPGDAARARRAQLEGGASGATPSDARVLLYFAEWCGACKKAKRHLKRRGVEYELRDIDQERWAEELVRRTGTRAIPVLDVDGRILTGFSANSYDALLGPA